MHATGDRLVVRCLATRLHEAALASRFQGRKNSCVLLSYSCPVPAAGDRLVVRCLAPKLHEAELAFRFQAQRWYHVVLTHSSGGAVASSWLHLFVNGTLEVSARARYPKVGWPHSQGITPVPQNFAPCE